MSVMMTLLTSVAHRRHAMGLRKPADKVAGIAEAQGFCNGIH